MSGQTRAIPLVLDAAQIEELREEPLGDLPGVRHRVMWREAASMAGVLSIDAGHRLGDHTHRRHHHHVWVLEGGVRILGHDLGPGAYAHIPAGMEHDIDARSTDGCAVLYLYLEGDDPDD